jgi:hypothetical protein
MAWFGTKFEQNCWRITPGLSAYSSQQHEKAERQQKTSRVQFCSNLVPNHFTVLSVAPRSLADSVHWFEMCKNILVALGLVDLCHLLLKILTKELGNRYYTSVFELKSIHFWNIFISHLMPIFFMRGKLTNNYLINFRLNKKFSYK